MLKDKELDKIIQALRDSYAAGYNQALTDILMLSYVPETLMEDINSLWKDTNGG